MNQIEERKKMIACMEYIARQVNDEDVFDYWLRMGIADGDIKYGDLDISSVDDYYVMENKTFKEMMTTFLILMNEAFKSGGLYCGGVVSLEKDEVYKK